MTYSTLSKKRRMQCPNYSEHTTEDDNFSYVRWHEWAEEKSKTHTQHRCPGCDLYVIWKPKKKAL